MQPSVSGLRSMLGDAAVVPDALGVRWRAQDGFGFAALIACLRQTLVRGVHLFEVDSSGCAGLSAGVIAALLRVLHAKSTVMWVSQQAASRELGRIYGPGLFEVGLDPERVLFVEAQRGGDVLWAVEEGLRSRAVGAVVGEFVWDQRSLDLTSTRRLALRSEATGVPAYIAAVAGKVGATAARTRWRVSSAPSRPAKGTALLGEPTWTLDLVKNREGPCARAVVGFSPARGEFFPVAADPRGRLGRPAFGPSGARAAPVTPLVVPFNAALRQDDEADRR